ncbi:MAG TPA: bifunctional 3-(3-hydroxy-phenyl)propionate/3-hydroxycinnamic acid hydroxylase [Ktedonobacteraceae bacterium]|nr:bifunctional 3-(3-hydroxy-phenyl)propionate/3-hydroxycinnamic acid hydroxylase [Ktedonobacteraceae bacterium]
MTNAPLEIETRRAQVVIVGAGPTGLVAANLLGLAGIETVVLERSAGLSSYPRAISIDDEGLRICQALGLLDEVLKDVLLDVPVRYLSGRHVLARIAPRQQRHGFPLFSVFYQPALEATWFQGLKRFPDVNCYFEHIVEGVEQDDQHVGLHVKTPAGDVVRLECDYLLACDGGRSQIRRQLGIAMRGRSAPQKWLVVDCEQDRSAETIIQFFCNPDRPAVTLPAPGQRRRWEFMLLPGEQESELLELERIRALIQLYDPASQVQVTRQAIYAFHALRAKQLSRGRIFLLGDAAHLMPPFGGQGLNSGLRDAHNLCWKLALVLGGQASPRLLESYQDERAEHVDQMIRFSTLLGRVIMPTVRPLALLRDMILGCLNLVPAAREIIREAAIKPPPKYKAGWQLPGGGIGGIKRQSLRGLMLPQPLVMNEAGKSVRLDELLGQGFALLRLTSDPQTAFVGWEGAYWEGLPLRLLGVIPRPGVLRKEKAAGLPLVVADPAVITIGDIQGVLGNLLQQRQDVYLLVRPDRYILDVFPVLDSATFQRTLKDSLLARNLI